MTARITLFPFLLISTTGWTDTPPRFPENAVWHRNIASAALHPDSTSMITELDSLGGFGFGSMRIDFSLHVVHATAEAPGLILGGSAVKTTVFSSGLLLTGMGTGGRLIK